jgi:hypothetical protein
MEGPKKERWFQLCQLAAIEQGEIVCGLDLSARAEKLSTQPKIPAQPQPVT